MLRMSELPINLFDVLLVIVLAGGVVHGRRRGLSVELPGVIKWLVMVLVCALLYGPLGMAFAQVGFFHLLSCYLLAYLGTALAVFLAFSMVQRQMAPKLEGTDFFGRGEYYLGMGSGMVRFGCMLLVALAVLNARQFTPAELKAIDLYQDQNYGSSVFPTLHSLQTAVFEKSLTGSLIHQGLGFLLITPTRVDQTVNDEPAGRPATPANKTDRPLKVAGTRQ